MQQLHLCRGGIAMREKLLLAATITLSLHLFAGASLPVKIHGFDLSRLPEAATQNPDPLSATSVIGLFNGTTVSNPSIE